MRKIYRYGPLFGLALIGVGALSQTMMAQIARDAIVTPSDPTVADVAVRFAKAVIAHDVASAATYVTDTSRADFLALMELSDRVKQARQDLQAAIAEKFKTEAVRAIRFEGPDDLVLTAEVGELRQLSPTNVDLDMRLFTTNRNRPTQTVTWRAVKADATWKIELPACANPQAAAPLRQNLQTTLAAHAAVTASVKNGTFADLAQAHAALVEAHRAAISQQIRVQP
jgi:hypothetical protein